MYIDDIKLFAKNEKELETLIQAVRIYSQDVGMEFSIERCKAMKSSKRKMMESMEQPNQEKKKKNKNARRKENVQVLENIGSRYHQTRGGERKILKRTRKLLESKQNSRNLTKGQNTWVLPLVRFSRPFLKWTRKELK